MAGNRSIARVLPLDAAPVSPYVQGTGSNDLRPRCVGGRFWRLLLSFLALPTGFAAAEGAWAAPAVPMAMGSLVLLAESTGKADTGDSEHRPVATTPTRRSSSSGVSGGKPRKAAPPHLPGLLTGVDRALE